MAGYGHAMQQTAISWCHLAAVILQVSFTSGNDVLEKRLLCQSAGTCEHRDHRLR